MKVLRRATGGWMETALALAAAGLKAMQHQRLQWQPIWQPASLSFGACRINAFSLGLNL